MAESMVALSAQQRADIQGRLRQLGFTQDRLAQVLEISQGGLNEKLKGKKSFRYTEVAAIASMLEMAALQEEYPESLSVQEKYARQKRLVLALLGEEFDKLSSRNRQEFYFLLARMLEGTPPYGERPASQILRSFSGLHVRACLETSVKE